MEDIKVMKQLGVVRGIVLFLLAFVPLWLFIGYIAASKLF
jgi:hypothetical protein